jgi:predicted adenylyl cyclase CyaB
MPHNVEIKAKVRNLESQVRLVRAFAPTSKQTFLQEDTFFKVPAGRLKLREFSEGPGELIQYERDDAAGPEESRYVIASIPDPAALKTVLKNALGVIAVVRKKRTVYLNGSTRIHFDEVDGLGAFIELEVVLAPAEELSHGIHETDQWMSRLKIEKRDLVAGAYVDLLQQVRTVHEHAFPTPTEANLADLLRDAKKARIARVALSDGIVVGHVVLSAVTITNAPEGFRALGLGPIAVQPEHQGHGVGSSLIRESLEQCRRDGYDMVVLLGDPGFYSRFGFTRARDYGIENEYGADEEFMVLALKGNALENIRGLVKYEPEFQTVSQEL